MTGGFCLKDVTLAGIAVTTGVHMMDSAALSGVRNWDRGLVAGSAELGRGLLDRWR
ncbi:hypothetical protein FB389_1849 [Rarobacter incanus]|uniref:Uncharacterized protein n=1 Tax=Rarobacter incanus TaxID=153494 RepID=A0A542SRA8_9MICO|nr:hypothetical protein FB389_1849 [Rarobacter incanus]